jgi:hypothetical protein
MTSSGFRNCTAEACVSSRLEKSGAMRKMFQNNFGNRVRVFQKSFGKQDPIFQKHFGNQSAIFQKKSR